MRRPAHRRPSALHSLLRRVGLAEMRTQEAELRATEEAEQNAHDVRLLRRMAETDPLIDLLNLRASGPLPQMRSSIFAAATRPPDLAVRIVVLLREVDVLGPQTFAKRLCKAVTEDVIEPMRACRLLSSAPIETQQHSDGVPFAGRFCPCCALPVAPRRRSIASGHPVSLWLMAFSGFACTHKARDRLATGRVRPAPPTRRGAQREAAQPAGPGGRVMTAL